MSQKIRAAVNPYPIPTPERRRIVQKLGELAAELDYEVDRRTEMADADWKMKHGSHNAMVRDELQQSAISLRIVATLIVQGGMSTGKARYWVASAVAYMKLVRLADNQGVIR